MPTMVWPLRSLRQYGHDADIFTFESGRRGPQGPGVYSFRCSRAKKLFELVQKNVHKNQEEQQQQSRRISLGTIIDQQTNDVQHHFLRPSVSSHQIQDQQSSVPTSPINPSSTAAALSSSEFTNAQYMNVGLPVAPNAGTPNAVITSPVNAYEHLIRPSIADGEQYENVTISPASEPRNAIKNDHLLEDPKVSYATLELNSPETAMTIALSSPSTSTENNNNINQQDNCQTENETPTNGPYALINLDMTQALSALNAGQLRHQADLDEPGIRRTRHNSTLEEITSFNLSNAKILG